MQAGRRPVVPCEEGRLIVSLTPMMIQETDRYAARRVSRGRAAGA